MAYIEHGQVPKRGRGDRVNGLTALQNNFVEAFCDPSSPAYRNAGEAVIAAGYKTPDKNKRIIGFQLTEHPLVKEAIKKRFDEREKRQELSANYLIHKLMGMVEECQRDSDKLRAIELLGKSIALWKERQEISGPDGKAIEMQERKIEQEVDDFKSRIKSLASRVDGGDAGGGTGEVIKFPLAEGNSQP